jgi:hypothetical protein
MVDPAASALLHLRPAEFTAAGAASLGPTAAALSAVREIPGPSPSPPPPLPLPLPLTLALALALALTLTLILTPTLALTLALTLNQVSRADRPRLSISYELRPSFGSEDVDAWLSRHGRGRTLL